MENGVEFTNGFGDINEGFYSSLESVYHDAMKLIDKMKLHDNYKIRAHEILKETENIGWGFHDTLSDFYYGIYDWKNTTC